MNQKKLIKKIQNATLGVNDVTLKVQEFAVKLTNPVIDNSKKKRYLRFVLVYMPFLVSIPFFYWYGWVGGFIMLFVMYFVCSFVEKVWVK